MATDKNVKNSTKQEPVVSSKKSTNNANLTKQLDKKLKNSSIQNINLEELNDKNIKNFTGNANRKRFIIILLIILLILSLVILIVIWDLNKSKNTCFLHSYGADVDFYVDDQNITEFKPPYGLTGNRIYEIKIEIKVNSPGVYNVKFRIEARQDSTVLENTLAYDYNTQLFDYRADGYYYSTATISSGQKFTIFKGVVIDEQYEDILTSSSFGMDVYVYFEKASL